MKENNFVAKTEWDESKTLKILCIGNSFSDDTTKYLGYISSELGAKNFSYGNLYIPGCTLKTHYENAMGDLGKYEYRTTKDGDWTTVPESKLSTALKDEDWDYISFQQQSGTSGKPETYVYLNDLIEYVKGFCPDATLLWNMTWAYQSDSTHSQFEYYGKNQLNMYNAITSTTKELIATDKRFTYISPVGTAIQNMRTSFVGDTVTRDGFHLSFNIGRFIAALTFFKTITGKSIDDVKFRPREFDEATINPIIESVNNAIENPFEITKSTYTKRP